MYECVTLKNEMIVELYIKKKKKYVETNSLSNLISIYT